MSGVLRRAARELPLVAVHVAVVVGFIRVYEPGGWFWPLLSFVLVAQALAITCRWARLPWAVPAVLAVVGAAVTAGWALFPETLRWGLPSGDTWRAAADALEVARTEYPVVIAPTEALAGFQLAAGLALWLAAWFADWTAHRMRATAEAVAPAATIFTFCAILGSGSHQVSTALLFAAAVLWFVVVARTSALEREQAWWPARRPAARSLLRGGLAFGAVALVAGTLLAPVLPGAGEESVVEWRGERGGDRSRVTVSPMVELRRRLVDQSDTEVFRVRSPIRAYWRLTSLDRFDGEIWSSSGEFGPAGDDLSSDWPSRSSEAFRQRFQITGLSAIWAPAAFEAVSVPASETDLRWDPDSSTLIVESGVPTSNGLSYTVVSQAPVQGPEELVGADGADPRRILEEYGELPDDFPDEAAETARRVTAGAEGRYEQARALQDWFRSEFTYSLDPPTAGHSTDALVSFLRSGTGYCEQFAGAYAAMARSLGIPARVAVGFTPGLVDPDDPMLYRVQGRHAHAWPEVFFADVGWVPFEPTPGRGNPTAEAVTGVPDQQDEGGNPAEVTTTTEATTTTVGAETETTVPADDEATPVQAETTDGRETDDEGGGRSDGPLVVGAAAVALLVGLATWVVRSRRASATVAAADGPARAWQRAATALAKRRGLPQDPSETHLEYAARAAPLLGPAGPLLDELALLVTEASWSIPGSAPTAERDAVIEALADRVVEAVAAPQPVG